jgi:hypothetical protein
MKLERLLSASPEARTCGWDWLLALPCTPGRSIRKWVPSSSENSNKRATSSWCVERIVRCFARLTRDLFQARDLVRRSSGVARTRELARAHSEKARELLQLLPDSDAKVSLEILTERVITRTW